MLPIGNEPLSDDEFEELAEFLMSDVTPDDTMDISMLEGYLAAFAIRPDLVRPNAWLPGIWGETGSAGFENQAQAGRVLTLIMRFYNEVVGALRADPEGFEPTFFTRTVEGREHMIVDEWCMGFVRGLKLNNPEWGRWMKDPDLRELIGPFVLFGTESGWDELISSGREADIHDETVPTLQPALAALAEKWRSASPPPPPQASTGRPGAAPTPTFVAPRAGRNDPCPCGSGKKYKRCCGLN